jgi:hypothetical protein
MHIFYLIPKVALLAIVLGLYALTRRKRGS